MQIGRFSAAEPSSIQRKVGRRLLLLRGPGGTDPVSRPDALPQKKKPQKNFSGTSPLCIPTAQAQIHNFLAGF